ncbi:MlaD family protein [Gordonia sp. CPCC 206044]|uniref:MlaD family protein n=1 Tax=Gordonia sp. CPCC 206044 TaxID=3140793 RepID=UPI003AF39667
MTRFSRAIVYLLVFAVFAVAGGVFIANAITRPLSGADGEYTAEFSNVSGLRVGNDVRTAGVRIGKVTAVDLHHDSTDDASTARVRFTLTDGNHIYTDSHLAIRYLNLTGIRYLDLQQKSRSGPTSSPNELIGIESTSPSFDITEVFNGLAPVFAVMNPSDINHFSESMLALVQGDGSGFSEVLDSLSTVLKFTDDRAALIDTLVNNLSTLSATLDGRSRYLNPIIDLLSRFGTELAAHKADFADLANVSGEAVVALDDLLDAVGLRRDQTPDLDAVVHQILPMAQAAVGLLSLTPGILNALNSVLPQADSTPTLTCSKGRAQLPANIALFVKGSQVTLCKR